MTSLFVNIGYGHCVYFRNFLGQLFSDFLHSVVKFFLLALGIFIGGFNFWKRINRTFLWTPE